MNVDVGTVKISVLQRQLVNKVLTSDRLSYGPMTEEFEKKWGKMHNTKYALFCNSGTSALQVALHALKEKYGWAEESEIILPSVTFVATLNVILHNNLRPHFVDVEGDYFNIDPSKIEAAINPLTKAIIVVHLLGQPAQMDKIMAIAKKYKLKVIEDSCETVGATYAGQPVGSFGDIGCFSTYASHLVVTGVGGFACTNDKDLAMRIKGLYNHGRDGIYHSIDDDDKNPVLSMESRFKFIHSGYSYRATELEAALGIGHLARFEKEFSRRNENVQQLITYLMDLEMKHDLVLPKIHPKATHSFMLFPIVVNPKKHKRDQIIQELENNGVKTRYLMPLLTQPYVKKLYGDLHKNFPVAKYIDDNAFLVGIHPGLTDKELRYMSDVIHMACDPVIDKREL